MRRALTLTLILAACAGEKAGPERRRGEPDVDPAVVAAAASTRCLVNRLERYESELDLPMMYERSTVVARAVALATTSVPRLPGDRRGERMDDMLAIVLAELGDVAGAKEVLARQANGSEVVGALKADRDLRLGAEVPDAELGLPAVPTLVALGDRARAERILAAHPREDGDRSVFQHAAALGALGKRDELDAALASSSRAGYVAAGWMYGAMLTGQDLAPAVAATAAAPRDEELDAILVSTVLIEAAVRGHGAATAPLRLAIRDHATGESHDELMVELAKAAAIAGAVPAELDSYEAALTDPSDDRTMRMRIERTIWTGALDDALAAVMAIDLPAAWRTEQLAALWGRHVHAGFSSAFEAKLAAAACEARCVMDRAAGASMRLSDAGGQVGETIAIPPTADRAAARAAIAGAQEPSCSLGIPERETFTLALLPSAKADLARTIAGGALDAGFASVTLVTLPSDDATAFTGEPCVVTAATLDAAPCAALTDTPTL